MRWAGQQVNTSSNDALPGLTRLHDLVATVRTPEFAGVTFYEVRAKSALNAVRGAADGSPMAWTINPYRGCSHACAYCFARPTHRYLEFDGDGAFDTEIVVKVNLVEVLRGELAKRSWHGQPVALGTNTDPYQRAEGRYRLMPGVLEALADAGSPISVLTKGTLLRRDVPLLARLADRVPVEVAMSIAVFDDDLQHAVEPGAPTVAARLATVRAVRDAGLDCGVLLMPVLPYLTDSVAHLDAAAAALAASGASTVQWTALHLKPGIRDWWFGWLREHHPELEGTYRAMYAEGPFAPKAYRAWLGDRIRPLLARHGLRVGEPFGVTAQQRRPPERVQPVLF